jgi:hypothetical protein
VILSKPFQPEFLCINHMPRGFYIKQDGPEKEANERYVVEPSYDSKQASEGVNGIPLVLNPALPKNADVLEVQLLRGGKKQPITIGKSNVKVIKFDDITIRVQTRKSGSSWVIEFFELTKA